MILWTKGSASHVKIGKGNDVREYDNTLHCERVRAKQEHRGNVRIKEDLSGDWTWR